MMLSFIPSLPTLAAFVLASIVLGVTPGPDMTFFLSKTVAQSRKAGFAAFAGATTGIAIHTVLVAIGLSALLAASATAFTVLKFVGAAYLAYLAYDALKHGSSLSLSSTAKPESLHAIYVKGLLINLLNPKIIIFFVTFLPQFVSADDANVPGKLLFLGLVFMLVNVPLCSGLILAAEKISGLLKGSSRAARFVDWLFAGVLGAFAVKLVLTHAK